MHNLTDHALDSDKELRWARLKYAPVLISRLLRIGLTNLTAIPEFIPTNLTNTKVVETKLDGTLIASADLRKVRGLSDPTKIDGAIGNKGTRLPKGLTGHSTYRPAAWDKGIEDQLRDSSGASHQHDCEQAARDSRG